MTKHKCGNNIIKSPLYMPNDGEDKSTYEGKKCCKTVFFYDFTKKYNANDFKIIFGLDGVESQDENGLKVESNPFSATIPIGNEHVKWLRLYNEPVILPDCGEVIYETKVALKQHINVESIPENMKPRIRNAFEDIRLAAGAVNCVDPSTWMVFDFLISDEMIYAFYERLPFGKPFWTGQAQTNPNEGGGYAAFSNAVPVSRRTGDPMNDFVRLGIGVNKSKGYVKWYVEGKEVFSWERIGTRLPDEYRMLEHGGEEEIVQMNSFNIGFGTFSLLDMALPYNYGREFVQGDQQNAAHLVELEADTGYKELYDTLDGKDRDLVDKSVTFAYQANAFPDNNREIKLFGQGATLRVKYQKVIWCE